MTKKRTKQRMTLPLAMAKKVVLWPLDRIKPYVNNARRHSETQIRKLATAITEFGFLVPLLVDENGGLLAGHGRLEAATRLKLKEIPVIELDHLTEEQKRAFIIADNKLSDMSDWDEGLLTAELAALEDAQYDIALTGYNDAELDALLGAAGSGEPEDSTTAPVDLKIYGGVTAMQRSSVPFDHWTEAGYLKGDVLDFGCGHDDYGFERYDAFTRPETRLLLRSWDVIMCNYVLSVQPADHLVIQIAALINRMLKQEGVALFAVRKDIKHTERGTSSVRLARTEEQWSEMLSQIFHVEPIDHKAFYGFVCMPRRMAAAGPAKRPKVRTRTAGGAKGREKKKRRMRG